MSHPFSRIRSAARLADRWLRLGSSSRRNRPLFDGVEAYCMFVGHPRSGHTIVGALLDGHPEVVLGHETDAGQYIWARFDRDRLFQMILDSIRAQGDRRWASGSYVYHVPGVRQGSFERLRVIGDNQAEGTTLRLGADPGLLARTRALVPALRVLHVVRHPLDNITTMARRARGRQAGDLRHALERYFSLCDIVARIRESLRPEELLTVEHHDFVDDPEAELGRICRWLGLEAGSEYLAACAGIVYPSPHRSRDLLPWPPELARDVERRLVRYPFLQRFRVNSCY